MILWIFWPSFCAALVPAELVPQTVVNVIIALCGSTLATYIFSVRLRKKINIADIANAALAGGVAIGSTCANANYLEAGIIGMIAGSLSTIGFAVIQSRQQKWMKLIDTCGVTNLHGIPGIFGGLVAMIFVSSTHIVYQLAGIGIAIVIALLGGVITGKLLSLLGRRKDAYDDAEEFQDAEA
jgi:ammonium transporter Rh